MRELSPIRVEFIPPENWKKRAKWKLLEEYVSDNGNITVPVGFVSDGASIPRIGQWLFSPTGKAFGAAIVHDYILITSENWEHANREFEAELKALKLPWWRRAILVGVVEGYGWIKRKLGISIKQL